MEEKFSLKDYLFNKEKVEKIAGEIKAVYPQFDKSKFVKTVVDRFPELELSGRIKWISENLRNFLPSDYQNATTILLKSLPPENDRSKTDNDFGDFIYGPYSDFVAQYGCNKNDLQFSLYALKEMTSRFTAEDSIRYFINAFPDETMAEILKWSRDSHYQIRRLASEGTRPKLPWSQKIKTKPVQAIPILDNLYFDNTRYVTRSVANHMNDISKIEPDLVFKTLSRWQKSEKLNQKEMDYIINQSLRTLIKQGNPQAIKFLNFSTDPKVKFSDFVIKIDPVKIGDYLEFSFKLTAQKDERLLIDYIIHFQNKTGNGHNKKVFKLKIVSMKKGQTLEITKKHRIYHMSTRRINPGSHKLEIQINGNRVGEKTFNVEEK
jgi:3-methyladenine DNA glycosylase AlkC